MGTTGLSPGLTVEYSLSAGDYMNSSQGVSFGDFYDVSQVDGYSLTPISMAPIDNRSDKSGDKSFPDAFNAKPAVCGKLCMNSCPPELRSYDSDGKFNGCVSICHAVKEREHREAFKKRCEAVKADSNNPERNLWPDCNLLETYNKATVYWDPNCKPTRGASPNKPWNGQWMTPGNNTHIGYEGPKCDGKNPDESFKTTGCWKISGAPGHENYCGTKGNLDKVTNEWTNESDINAAYDALLAKNKDGQQQCKFLTDLLCCDVGSLTKANGVAVSNTCLNPFSGADSNNSCGWADGVNAANNYSQFGCSPYNEKYGLSKDRQDYYQRRICWLEDWPLPNKEWCKANNIEDKDCNYAGIFKKNCPNAYSWQFDDLNSTYVASAADYYVTLCPNLKANI